MWACVGEHLFTVIKNSVRLTISIPRSIPIKTLPKVWLEEGKLVMEWKFPLPPPHPKS